MTQAIIFIGIQATGKSTFYREKFFNTHVRISLDLLKTRHREKSFLNACFQTQQKFVVDNTNPTFKERERYITLAKQAKFEIVGYYFESKIADSLQRNEHRSLKERIPEKGILGAYNKLEIPNLSEGFDRLFYVKTISNNSFKVEEWLNEV